MGFGFIVEFASFQPPFSVKSVNGGYQFIFDLSDNKKHTISINSNIVESLQAATGFTGYEAEAIEQFRKYGKGKWPDRFHV